MAKSGARSTNVHAGRRAVLQGIAALAASGWLPQSIAQSGSAAIAPASFAATSRAYTGYLFQDPSVAAAMVRALNAAVGSTNLARLATLATRTPPSDLDAALKSAGLEQTAETVVIALYTGTVETPKGAVVVSYNQALVWQACAWTKPNALCGGATNYWASAPAGVTS
jgi:fructose 5-dehydrogenase small subunit